MIFVDTSALLAFLDRETEALTGLRLAAPVVDTVRLARRLLEGRTSRASLAPCASMMSYRRRPIESRAGRNRAGRRTARPRARAWSYRAWC